MELIEISKQYDVPLDLLQQFIKIGVLDDIVHNSDLDSYGDQEVKRFEFCICLNLLGFDINDVKEYLVFDMSKQDTKKERIVMLQKHRSIHLKTIHKAKKTMNCIECVLQEIELQKQS